jgi:hypothetical protein
MLDLMAPQSLRFIAGSSVRREMPVGVESAPGIALWNSRQAKTFRRFGSMYRLPLTAELVSPLARRYAEKHEETRPRLLRDKRVP